MTPPCDTAPFNLPPWDIAPAYYSGGVPVFTPSADQFRDFYRYQRLMHPFGMAAGIAKVVPPPEWTLQLAYDPAVLAAVRIRLPIVQHVNMVLPGVYTIENMERVKSYTLEQWAGVALDAVGPRRKSGVDGGGAEAGGDQGQVGETDQGGVGETDQGRSTNHGRTSTNHSRTSTNHTPTSPPESSLELQYWRTLTYATPTYGADSLGLVFPPNLPWNIAQLPLLLSFLDARVPGVNDAYLYAGLWKATFAWHLEDQDLHLINFLHQGAAKQWYAIPQSHRARFEAVMRELFPEAAAACPEFLRHKTFHVLPRVLEARGVAVNRIEHRPGEFMVTYPFGYHAGFNYGRNLAESVNFALEEWLETDARAGVCMCVADSVGVDVARLAAVFRGQPWVHDAGVRGAGVHAAAAPDSAKPRKRRQRVQCAGAECRACPAVLPPWAHGLVPFRLVGGVHAVCAAGVLPRTLRLRCVACHGAGPGVQCAHGKCTRAYHGVCGVFAGMDMDRGVCRFHRGEAAGDVVVAVGDVVQFRMGGAVAAGVVERSVRDEEVVEVRVVSGELVEVGDGAVVGVVRAGAKAGAKTGAKAGARTQAVVNAVSLSMATPRSQAPVVVPPVFLPPQGVFVHMGGAGGAYGVAGVEEVRRQ